MLAKSKKAPQINSLEKTNRKPSRILVAGKDLSQRNQHKRVLEQHGYAIYLAKNIFETVVLLNEEYFDVVVLEEDLDLEILCGHMRGRLEQSNLPILLVTEDHIGKDVINNLDYCFLDFIRKPYTPTELIARLELAVQKKREADQSDNVESVLYALARMVEAKDENTGDHCSRLEYTANVFGQALGLEEHELIALRRGSVLHDIGKLGIPDKILLKDSPLTDDEWGIMQQHTKIGVQLCAGLKSMRLTLPIIAYHHERWDGSGYPFGLKGEQIPYLARIFQCLDIYDALSNKRPYKKAFAYNEIINIMNEEVTRGWRDPELTAKFIDILRNHPDDLILPKNEAMDDGALIFQEILATGVLD